jgi:CheY-like chemotaxis protein
MSDELNGLRVLVVEDEYLLAYDVEETMTSLGAEVVGPFGRVEPALAVARAERLDGAVLDVRLDGDTVFRVAEALLARGVPIILTTGYEEDQLPGYLRGVPRLRKPYDRQALRRLARCAYRRR